MRGDSVGERREEAWEEGGRRRTRGEGGWGVAGDVRAVLVVMMMVLVRWWTVEGESWWVVVVVDDREEVRFVGRRVWWRALRLFL